MNEVHKNIDYNSAYANRKPIRAKKIILPFGFWFRKVVRVDQLTVLDFGSNIESNFFRHCEKKVHQYFGFDVDIQTRDWLEKNGRYFDFYNEPRTSFFDAINGSQVFEHLSPIERKVFVERSFDLLKP